MKYYFYLWRDEGTDQDVHDLLRWQLREKRKRLADPSLVVLDTQSVHASVGVPAATTGRDDRRVGSPERNRRSSGQEDAVLPAHHQHSSEGRRPMNHLTHILAGTVMDLDVTIRSSYVPDPVDPDDPRGVAPAEAANLLEPISPVKTALEQASEQDRREFVQLFRVIAAQVPERGRLFATVLCEEMAAALDQPHERGQGQGQASITRALAKAMMDIFNAIELADEDTIDDDDAVEITEWVSGNLNNALAKRPEEDRQELVRLLCDIAGEEQDPERRELALQFPEAVGLVPEE